METKGDYLTATKHDDGSYTIVQNGYGKHKTFRSFHMKRLIEKAIRTCGHDWDRALILEVGICETKSGWKKQRTTAPKEHREELPVIFRADRYGPTKGEITAIFPTMPGKTDGSTFTCYAHMGQHGDCSYAWYAQRTRPAKSEEYADLLAELRSIYEEKIVPSDTVFTLKIVKRMTPQHREAFLTELRRSFTK